MSTVPKPCLVNVEGYLERKRDDKQLTYSGYKRSKVLQSFNKDLVGKNPIGAVYWMSELIVSGEYKTLLNKCIIFFMKNINISNPNLPSYMYKVVRILEDIVVNYKGNTYSIANDQIVRNRICELVSILALSDKQKTGTRIKCQDKEFNVALLREKMEADGKYLKGFWRSGDERVTLVPFNEFRYHIHRTYNREKAFFWISWILELYKRSKRNKVELQFEARENQVPKRYRTSFVWLLWDIIIREAEDRGDPHLEREIYAIHKLYKMGFTGRHVTSRISYILCAVSYLTQTIPPIRFTRDICNNYDVLTLINVQINVLFKGLCNNYDEFLERVQKRAFYNRSFQNLVCHKQTQPQKIQRHVHPPPIPKPIATRGTQKAAKSVPKIDVKYYSQVGKIANFQYRRGLNI